MKHQFRCIFISGKERYSFSRGAAPEEMRGPARSTPGWRPPLTAGPALPERVRERAVPVALRGRRLRSVAVVSQGRRLRAWQRSGGGRAFAGRGGGRSPRRVGPSGGSEGGVSGRGGSVQVYLGGRRTTQQTK